MKSDYDKPINIGSDEMISINDLAKLALSFDKKEDMVEIKHIQGPEGVRGRNSENTLIKQVLGWTPQIKLADGLNRTYVWIKQQCEIIKSSKDGDKVDLQHSTIVKQNEEELNDFNFDV